MKLALTVAAAASLAFITATAQASPQPQPVNTSYDRLAPLPASVSDNGTTSPAVEQVAVRHGARYYRSYPRRYYYQPRYPGYRYYPSYRYYRYYPRYYDGYRGRYYNNYRGGVGIYGRNFPFGFGF